MPPSTPVEVNPCEELWFDDGSVILRSPPLKFRVYRGLLSAHSKVFRDMFSIPQPADAETETMDDVPVVDLHDDAQDLMYFLRALNDICFYDENMRDFHKIAAILRLSTKYDVPSLRIRAIDQLLTAYPATLQEFNNILHDPTSSRVNGFDGMEVAVVNLGEEIDIPQLLPSAYYKLAGQQDERCLFTGVVNPYTPNSAPEILCQTALLRCMKGMEAIRRCMVREIYGFVFNVCPYNIGTCHPGRMIALRAIDDGLTAKTLGPFHGGQVDVSALCVNCQRYVRDVYPRVQKQAWERLPGWFDLPTWEQLSQQET